MWPKVLWFYETAILKKRNPSKKQQALAYTLFMLGLVLAVVASLLVMYSHKAEPKAPPGAMFIYGYVSSRTADGILFNLKKLILGDLATNTRGIIRRTHIRS